MLHRPFGPGIRERRRHRGCQNLAFVGFNMASTLRGYVTSRHVAVWVDSEGSWLQGRASVSRVEANRCIAESVRVQQSRND